MTDRHKKLFSLFKLAIEMERKQQEVFLRALEVCDDDELRALVEALHRGEIQHEQILLDSYEKYRTRYVAADADLK